MTVLLRLKAKHAKRTSISLSQNTSLVITMGLDKRHSSYSVRTCRKTVLSRCPHAKTSLHSAACLRTRRVMYNSSQVTSRTWGRISKFRHRGSDMIDKCVHAAIITRFDFRHYIVTSTARKCTCRPLTTDLNYPRGFYNWVAVNSNNSTNGAPCATWRCTSVLISRHQL